MKQREKQSLITAFKPHGEGLGKLFGSLESEIMDLLWAQRESTARDIFEGLRDRGQRLSYGAVKTVLDRLVKKDVLERTMENNQYFYRAILSREEFTNGAVREIIGSLLDSFADPVYAQFLDQLKADPSQLERLSQMISDAESRKKSK
ncbi:MAG: hypothetical protein Fur005_14590 [Roseiflexaceae bacterium]